MTTDQVSLSMDDATIVWSIVEKQLDAFCQAWDTHRKHFPLIILSDCRR